MMTATERLLKAIDDYIEAKVDERLARENPSEQDVSLTIRSGALRLELQKALRAFRAAG